MKMLPKILALVILTIFVLSTVPVALAVPQERASRVAITASEVRENQNSEEQDNENSNNTGERVREQAREQANEVKEQYKEKVEEIKNRIRSARENWEQARERYEQQRESLKQTRDEASSCRTAVNNTPCKEKKSELNRGIKQHLLKTVDLIDSSIQRLIDQVNKSNVLSEAEKKQALDSITELETKLTTEKDKINALAENATNAELKTTIKELKKMWQDVRTEQRRIITLLINSKLGNLVTKHDEYYNAMLLRIDTLKKQGADTTELEKLAADFKALIDKVKADQQLADQAWAKAKDEQSIESVHDAQETVKDDMKEAKEVLKEFMEKYRELQKLESRANSENNRTAETTA